MTKKAGLVHPESPGGFKKKANRPAGTVWLLMRDNGLCAKAAKKYKAATTSCLSRAQPVVTNFTADAPDPKWVSDITYIWTEEGWLYLAVVLELYSRRIIGWAIGERMTATLV